MERTVTLEKHSLTVTVRELTVADIRGWLKGISEGEKFNLVNAALFQDEGVSLDDVLMMTSLDPGELEQLTPAEVVKIIEKCREANPHFFSFRASMIETGRPETPPPSDSN